MISKRIKSGREIDDRTVARTQGLCGIPVQLNLKGRDARLEVIRDDLDVDLVVIAGTGSTAAVENTRRTQCHAAA